MNSFDSSPVSSGATTPSYDLLKSFMLWRWLAKFAKFNVLLDAFFNSLNLDDAPQVRYKRDRQGEFYVEVYYPSSGQIRTFDSEEHARTWLERRISQQTKINDLTRDIRRR